MSKLRELQIQIGRYERVASYYANDIRTTAILEEVLEEILGEIRRIKLLLDALDEALEG